MKQRHAKRICFCQDCIRCGCGMWERHHVSRRFVKRMPRRDWGWTNR